MCTLCVCVGGGGGIKKEKVPIAPKMHDTFGKAISHQKLLKYLFKDLLSHIIGYKFSCFLFVLFLIFYLHQFCLRSRKEAYPSTSEQIQHGVRIEYIMEDCWTLTLKHVAPIARWFHLKKK